MNESRKNSYGFKKSHFIYVSFSEEILLRVLLCCYFLAKCCWKLKEREDEDAVRFL